MRTEQQMFDLIIGTAEAEERIRGAYLTGSRVNPNAPRDIFQDYDVTYVVEETRSFRTDRGWIDRFGERLYMQYPEEGAYSASDVEACYGWLMQFADGNRLDLHVCTRAYLPQNLAENKLYRVLLDKEGCLPDHDRETDEDFWVKRFTEEQFLGTCNEFWWCLNNVAKGLWREEIPYVMEMLNGYVRPMLTRLLEFQIGIETDFRVSVGKSAKYLKNRLSAANWDSYLRTYAAADCDAVWSAVFVMCDLFHETALAVSGRTGFVYNQTEARNSRAYLEHVRRLPRDAMSVY